MSDINTPVEVQISDDLDTFSDDFFGQKTFVAEPASSTEAEPAEDVTDALEPNTPVEDADGDSEDQEDQTEAEEVDETPPEPKLTPTQKRINEVVGKQRAAERALEAETAARRALEAQLAAMKQDPPKETPVTEKAGPTPQDIKEDGTDKYPLGEFDPEYIRDLVRFENERDRAAYDERRRQEDALREEQSKQQALAANWNEKLGPARERYPDFTEASQDLVDSFRDLDQGYGEYLASTIMDMEFGPDVLYYLAQNPDEANAIVASGATKATIALGRLEAKFAEAKAEKVIAKPRVSQASAPPPQNKGNNAVVIEVAGDTDDLDAFSAELFKKRRG